MTTATHPLLLSLALIETVAAQAEPRADRSVVVERDLDYLGAERAEKLDIYRPARVPDGVRVPGIVIVHGGGWQKGDKAAAREVNIATALARAGYVCASVNYALGGEGRPTPWPRNLHDCKTAVRLLRANAKRYRLDPARIGAIGGSAGGHLVSMLGVAGPEVGLEPEAPYAGVSTRVQAVVDLYGVTSLLTRQQTDASGEPTGEPKDGPVPVLLGRSRTEAPDLWRRASPITHVSAGDPPFFVLHGMRDTTVDYLQSKDFARALESAGVPCELALIPGVGHTFDLDRWRDERMPADVKPRVVAFFDRYLKPPHPAAVLAARVHESDGGRLLYRELAPPVDGDARVPMVLFLHGAGERGDDNRAQLKHGVADLVAPYWQDREPCVVVAPQCPRGSRWTDPRVHALCVELVEALAERHPIDRDRVYVTGLSMGGYGTWNMIARQPDVFAAAVPICGGGDPSTAAKITDLPIWAFHGDADRAVPVEKSRSMIEAIRRAGGRPRYTEYAGVRHDSWTRTYADPSVLAWLFAQRRGRGAAGGRR